jgi:hypothetical protein
MRSGRKRERIVDIPQARADLEWLRSRYDGGAVSAAVYTTIKRLETDISWAEHWQSFGDVVNEIIGKLKEEQS